MNLKKCEALDCVNLSIFRFWKVSMFRDLVTIACMFFLYCQIGWVWECIYESILNKKLLNRGFLHGPYIPIYGIGGMIILLGFQRFQTPLWSTKTIWIYVIGALGATLLEYVTSVFLEKKLNARWWDYSNYPLNFQGRICLIATLFWGVVAVVAIDILNPFLAEAATHIPLIFMILYAGIMAILMIIDAIITIHSVRHKKFASSRNNIVFVDKKED